MRPLKSLTLERIISLLSETFHSLPDSRLASRVDFTLPNTLMSAFALLFFQHPSLLAFQRALERKHKSSNLKTLFGVERVPSDTQMREILDGAPVEPLRRVLPDLFERIRRAGWAGRFKTSLPTGPSHQSTDYYVVALDGSEYFHSTRIQCPGCLKQTDAKGELHYSHQEVAATLVKAGSHRILPLDFEEVRNSDGHDKQDCEINACKRLLPRLRGEHPQLRMLVTADDLYAHQPFVAELERLRIHYVLVAKPDSHRELFEWADEIDRLNHHPRIRWSEGPACQRRHFECRVIEQVPLSAEHQSWVTLVEVWQRNRSGELVYHNSWVTDLPVHAANVAVVVETGRAKLKIENEQFNVHKNHGYELEHNYGHGRQTLSVVFYALNLLAFVVHQILEMGDRLYQHCRRQETLRELWNGLRTLVARFWVDSWAQLLELWLQEERASP
jgi:hypothetical protein